ncbi:hypothetical protein C5167_038317 [Papaver somniferum]|uniref:Uncharacterized protein n=1 Tax=Papaver somniferum TaxID=3469 RepID=A0A4Y7IBF2_PAPSO|nr:hypothetical protein C5167_038317 [Papaver somniferum]
MKSLMGCKEVSDMVFAYYNFVQLFNPSEARK